MALDSADMGETSSGLGSRFRKVVQLLGRLVPVLAQRDGVGALLYGRPRSIAAATIVHGLKRELPMQPTLVIDGGANVGQFADAVRRGFPGVDLRSFEPVQDVFSVLSQNVGEAEEVTLINKALGATTGQTQINVNKYRHASSVLDAKQGGAANFDKFRKERSETIEVVTLDDYLDGESVEGYWLLKLDVQGYELQVLRGAKDSISNFEAVLVEVGIRPTYEGEATLSELMAVLSVSGHRLSAVLDVTRDDDQRIVQLDALFLRDDESA